MDYGLLYDSIDMWTMQIKQIDKERQALVAKAAWSDKDILRADELDRTIADIQEKIRVTRLKLLEAQSVTSVD
jgi:predicted ATPase with chaperone activity